MIIHTMHLTRDARAKGVPESLVEGTTQTFGHEILGQAISVPPFVAVFELLARSLKAFGESREAFGRAVSHGNAVAA